MILSIWTGNVITEEQTLTIQQAIDLAVKYHQKMTCLKQKVSISKYFRLALISLLPWIYLAWLLIMLAKTIMSTEQIIALVGMALWAASQAMQ